MGRNCYLFFSFYLVTSKLSIQPAETTTKKDGNTTHYVDTRNTIQKGKQVNFEMISLQYFKSVGILKATKIVVNPN